MPNHVTHVCTVTGSGGNVARFVEAHIKEGEGEGKVFDFHTIIPKPACLDDISSSSTQEMAMYALAGYEKPPRFSFQKTSGTFEDFVERYGMLRGAGIRTREQLAEWLEKTYPGSLEEGRRALKAVEETGYSDWYEWSIANWGTKWGAYSYEERGRSPGWFEFKFETAWSFPEPIFEKLAEMYPDLVFALKSFDEGWNFACAGEFNGKDDFGDVKATAEMYEAVYGHAPPKDDE